MITVARIPRRPVHIVYRDLTACGAPLRELLAIGADNGDNPLYVTCPRRKRLAPKHCPVWVVESI